ncbi:lipase family protein [Actinocrispum sp. NPDC049592]|uniref:alpha/beta hydrolase family protein n=1 Tax=Actinocrispum sp. NPDC049592 TaxID=3154835 RepID=UPI0034226A4F
MNKLKSVLLAFCVVVTGLLLPTNAAMADTPGRLVSSEPLPANLWLPNTGKAYRVSYTSYDVRGLPTLVTGAVFLPKGLTPYKGFPVVAWAHGTVGIADNCAPSTNGRSQRDIDYLKAWLAAGYAVAATDYEGLGTPTQHPYENGRSEARSVIDLVRALPAVDWRLGKRWLAVGQSQGAQATMFTGSLVKSYAPELDFRGTIATGMPSQWRTLAEVAHVYDPAAPPIPEVLLIISGLAVAHPTQVHPADLLTPLGQDLYTKSREGYCYDDLAAQFAGKTNGDIFAIDTTERALVQNLVDQDAEIPVKEYAGPVFIAQGTADTVVYPPASQTTADNLKAAGNDVTLKFYPGADHDTTLQAALPDLLAFASAHMAA